MIRTEAAILVPSFIFDSISSPQRSSLYRRQRPQTFDSFGHERAFGKPQQFFEQSAGDAEARLIDLVLCLSDLVRPPERRVRAGEDKARRGDVVIADSTHFTTLFGQTDSLVNFWRNFATM